jgi:DNA-binding HxlR family transcriptional regulator
VKQKKFGNRICSVARALDILGDKWIFLIIREAFFGVRYYDKFKANLGIATNILSDRLKILVENGIFEKKKDDMDSRRIRYRFTQKGIDIYIITLALMQWGDRYLSEDGDIPVVLHHKICGKRLKPIMVCGHCGEIINARDVTYKDGNE